MMMDVIMVMIMMTNVVMLTMTSNKVNSVNW